MNENILCSNISDLRRASGLTQEQLAVRLGVTYQAVSKWENSQSCPDVMLLPDIADIFGVTVDRLYGRATQSESFSTPSAEQEEQAANLEFPWPDDNTLYAVLFHGHQLITDEPLACSGEYERIRFEYSGPAINIHSCFSVACDEECTIEGGITAGGDVACGDVKGNINAGGSVDCGDVAGSVNACVNINCGDVGLNASACGNISCGDVGKNVSAGRNVSCGDVGECFTIGDFAKFSGSSSADERTAPPDIDLSRLSKDMSEIGKDISGISEYVKGMLSDVFGKSE